MKATSLEATPNYLVNNKTIERFHVAGKPRFFPLQASSLV